MKSFNQIAAQTLLIAATLFSASNVSAIEPSVSFAEPKANATVSSPFTVKFNVTGKEIGALGDMDANKGHHHLIINGEPVAEGVSVPVDDKHIHYGKGQTEAQITLPAGKHTLTLQFANGAHQSYGPKMSSTMVVNVKQPSTY